MSIFGLIDHRPNDRISQNGKYESCSYRRTKHNGAKNCSDDWPDAPPRATVSGGGSAGQTSLIALKF